MKKFLKLAIIPAAFIAIALTPSCAQSTAEVALITDVGDIDDGSFNQSSWEAIKEYCTDPKHILSHDYYRPTADSNFARRLAIQQAVEKKAKIIICPGFKFASTISRAQLDYPDVHFVLLDSTTTNYKMKNTLCANYSPEISGFMAGYAIAQDYIKYDMKHDGIRKEYKYGYCGGTSYASVYTFGYGFVQGCILGTKDMVNTLNVDLPKLYFNYNYAGVFAQDDAAAARIKDWYADGYKAVFACGGKLFQSITEGVKDYNIKNGYDRAKEGELNRDAARWVGVDTDQYKGLTDQDDKKTIITSALKGLRPTILTALDKHHNNNWNDIGDTTRDNVKHYFDTKEAAQAYLDNEDTKTGATKALFDRFDTRIENAGDGKFKIMMRRSGSDDAYFEFEDQTKKAWLLGLNSKLGYDDGNPYQDFVGLPVEEDKTPESKMRGFYEFTYKDYQNLKNKIINPGEKYFGKIYNGGGNELYYKENLEKKYDPIKPDPDNPFIKEGYPTFMDGKQIDHYYLPPAGEKTVADTTFREYYFGGYNSSQIVMSVI